MNKVNEPVLDWGGDWTETKLQAFEAYVNAYLTIMNAQKVKYNGWPTTIYFDGFAGSGKNCSSEEKNKESNNNLLIKNLNYEEKYVYKGSAERVLALNKKFDEYYFVDIDKSSIDQLRNHLDQKFNLSDFKCNFINGDVNDILKDFSSKLTKKDAALILLDPFGMDIEWESILSLKGKIVDLWILVPSGVIVNRLLDKKGELKYIKTLEKFFGLNEQKIKGIFYRKEEQPNLFGIDEITQKISNPIKRIAAIYVYQLKNVFKFVTNEPLILLNSKNVPIYHFVFASNNKTAMKIASQIIGNIQK
jgi:three-Cys-motif partner protein